MVLVPLPPVSGLEGGPLSVVLLSVGRRCEWEKRGLSRAAWDRLRAWGAGRQPHRGWGLRLERQGGKREPKGPDKPCCR